MYILHLSRSQRNTWFLENYSGEREENPHFECPHSWDSQMMLVPPVTSPQPPSSSLRPLWAQGKTVSITHLSVLCPKKERNQERDCWVGGKASSVGRDMGTMLQLWPKVSVHSHGLGKAPCCSAPPVSQPDMRKRRWDRPCLLSVFRIKAEGKLGRKERAPCKLGSCNTSEDSRRVRATGSSQCLSVPGRRPSGQRQALSTE